MKIVVDNTATVERVGVDDSKAYNIIFDAKMAKILADGLYSDKVKSVIRELCCNAYDSHIMAGCEDKPIEVHLPTRLEPFFSVTDFGVGLNNSEVHSIFTTYGASTKTTSNDVVGQLGLGSKSPFAITDAFDVVARKDGMENLYSMHRDEKGMPSVTRTLTRQTHCPNGVTVKVPVGRDLLNEFITKAQEVFKWFPTKPLVTNAELEYSMNMLYSGTGWAIRSAANKKSAYGYRHHYETPVAVMGMVAYPLNRLSISGLSDVAGELLTIPTVLYFDIGELEVAANREAIGYDERTCANIVAKMDKMIAELKAMFESKIASASSLWLAKIMYSEIFDKSEYSYQFSLVCGKLGLKWNQHVVDSGHIALDVAKIYPTVSKGTLNVIESQISLINWRYKRPRKCTDTLISIECTPSTTIVFNDLKSGGLNRVAEYYKSQNNQSSRIYIFGSSSKCDWATIQSELGNVNVIWASSLPAKPRKETVRTGMLWYDHTKSFGRRAWVPVDIDVEQGGFYVVLDGWNVKRGDYPADLDWWLGQAKSAGLLATDIKIYAMRNKHKKLVMEHPKWQEFFSALKSKLEQTIASRNIGQELANSKQMSKLRDIAQVPLWTSSQLENSITSPTSKMLDFIRTVQQYSFKPTDVTSLQTLAFEFNMEISKKTEVQHDLAAMYADVMKMYPMLEFAGARRYYGSSLTETEWQTICNYVNYVDATDVFYRLQDE